MLKSSLEFSAVANIVEEIATASGTLSKQEILRRYEHATGFKEILNFIYNPYVLTGIATAKLIKGSHGCKPAVHITWSDAIKYFSMYNTGSDADIFYAWQFINSQYSDLLSQRLAKAMVTKNLKIGVTAKTLNKVYGADFIPIIDLMLGKSYQDYKHLVTGPFIITEKLDGHRRLLIKEHGIVSIHTRSGIKDEGLVDIEAEAAFLPDNTVYDGEALAIGNFRNALELRQATNSIMNSNGIRTGVTFNIFDMLPLSEFRQGVSSQPAFVRKAIACSLFKDTSIHHLGRSVPSLVDIVGVSEGIKELQVIKTVPILGVAHTEKAILQHAENIWYGGFEGVMALQSMSKYELKRSNNLLKVKATETLELPIIDFVEGTGKYQGMLGSFIVDYKGFPVGVGSGLTNADRDSFWHNRDKLVGVKIEINTFGETTNKDGSLSLNCGIFKGLRYDKGGSDD